MSIEQRLDRIEARNAVVENDKAWETSWTRRGLIASITYVTVAAFLVIIDVDRPWVAAMVPVIGFVLSTLTLPIGKRVWISKRCRK
jgi:hypothetical protein